MGNPVVKHDLVSPRLPPDSSTTSLKDHFGFDNTAALFSALQQPLPADDLKAICSVFSYDDAPTPPLSRSLVIIGVADQSLAAVRKLVGNNNNDDDDDDDSIIAACLTTCQIAVRRADGAYHQRLREKDVINSAAFGALVNRLRAEELVAVTAQDKYGRFGILQPVRDTAEPAADYVVACHVGNVEQVKDFLAQGMAAAPVAATSSESSNGGLWQPPGAPDATGAGATNGGDLWQPPSAGEDEETTTATNFWQPPSGGGGAFAFADNAATAESNAWEPPALNESAVAYESSSSNKPAVKSEFHADSGAAAADKFYSKLTRSLDTRADSRLYHMRAFNGWVKATQIQELNPKTRLPGSKKLGGPIRVLDLACGKGGDLGKWILHSRTVSNYVGIDVARGSLVDAAIRARQMRQKLKTCTFTVADLGADVPGRFKSPSRTQMQKLSSWSIQGEAEHETNPPAFEMVRGGGVSMDDKFDVISVQFAIHYMMSSQKRARRFFQTASELLEIGGELIATTIDARVVINHIMKLGLDLHFDENRTEEKPEAIIQVGGGACRIRFTPEIVEKIFSSKSGDDLFGLEYTFTLVEGSDHDAGVGDAVNLPEWLTPIPVLESLAKEAGLELVYAQNFHEFFSKRSDPSSNAGAHSSLYNMRVLNRSGSVSEEEYEISRLYAAIKFRKVRESSITLEESDDEEENADDVEEEDAVMEDAEEKELEIDPALKAKLMPMAMMKAKRVAGDDVWKSLSSDEKTHLTGIELENLAATKS
jgi:mRNA (guanine-N7-)-methyltransferase